jgi:hypothetical protein
MQFFKARNLGGLQRQLGLQEDARVSLQIMTGGATGAFLWDLESGNTYLLISAQEIIRGKNQVPERVRQILSASDEELRNYWLSEQNWDDDRESVMSELAAREIMVADLEEIGKSARAM